jgi:hypothetical protein
MCHHLCRSKEPLLLNLFAAAIADPSIHFTSAVEEPSFNKFAMEGKMRKKSSPPTKIRAKTREHAGSI